VPPPLLLLERAISAALNFDVVIDSVPAGSPLFRLEQLDGASLSLDAARCHSGPRESFAEWPPHRVFEQPASEDRAC
jgi:hypothetical protein